MVFTTLAFSQMAHVLAIRSNVDSLFRIGLLSNRWLAAAVMATIMLQLAVIYVPSLQGIFSTATLSPLDLGISAAVASLVFCSVEAEKWLMRRRPTH